MASRRRPGEPIAGLPRGYEAGGAGRPRGVAGRPPARTTHVSRVLMKLALRDRAQAVVFAYESGLIRPGE